MQNTSFETREDYINVLKELCTPLKLYYSNGRALLRVGFTGASYSDNTIGLEGFSRVLWGLIPLWAGGGNSCLDEYVKIGFKNGCDPSHSEYWGTFGDCYQAFVEMAAFGLGLMLAPEMIWEPLTLTERQNLNKWLLQINEHQLPENNWLFFRVLVNSGLRHVGAEYSEENLNKALNRIDEFYLGDGWYSDGLTMQRDYYIAFAMHFYGLVYASLNKENDPERAERYCSRAKLFAQDYIYWFGKEGEALPFGRSLTYRFAQVSFFSALTFAGVEVFPWGVVKGIINRHFRWWFQQPILDGENKLTLGYGYPNLLMTEGYNAPNSPYWSFKSFLILALKQDHPFWQAKEEELPPLDSVREMKHPYMIIQRTQNGHVTALTSGQYASWNPVHMAEKYEKFAYSSYFGFHVPRSYMTLNQVAPDNMLAFLRDGYYHVRRKCEELRIQDGKIYSKWIPASGIEVETILIPSGNGHVRHHTIRTEEACLAVEGGFGLSFDAESELDIKCEKGKSYIRGKMGTTFITLRVGEGEGKTVLCEPNTNLLYPRTMLPYLEYYLPVGTTEIEVYVEGSESHEPNCRKAEKKEYHHEGRSD